MTAVLDACAGLAANVNAVTALESMSAGAVACIVLSLLVYLLVYGLPFLAATPGLPRRG